MSKAISRTRFHLSMNVWAKRRIMSCGIKCIINMNVLLIHIQSLTLFLVKYLPHLYMKAIRTNENMLLSLTIFLSQFKWGELYFLAFHSCILYRKKYLHTSQQRCHIVCKTCSDCCVNNLRITKSYVRRLSIMRENSRVRRSPNPIWFLNSPISMIDCTCKYLRNRKNTIWNLFWIGLSVTDYGLR